MLPHHLKRVLVFVATFIFGAVVVFLVVLVGSSLGLFKLPFFVSFCSYCLWRVAHPFFGPCPSGLNPRSKFLWGLLPSFFVMPHPAMQRTVTLHVGWVPEVISRSDFVDMLKERFGSWKLLGVQFLPCLKAQLTFDSVEARVIIEKNTEIDIGGYPCRVVGGGVRGKKCPRFPSSL